jgi:hypothetical protein
MLDVVEILYRERNPVPGFCDGDSGDVDVGSELLRAIKHLLMCRTFRVDRDVGVTHAALSSVTAAVVCQVAAPGDSGDPVGVPDGMGSATGVSLGV